MIKKIIVIVAVIEVLLLSIDMLATYSVRDTNLFLNASILWDWLHFPASFLRNFATRPHPFGMSFDLSLLVRLIIFFGAWLLCVVQMVLVVSGVALCCSYVKQKITAASI